MMALKGDKEIGDKINIGKLADANELKGVIDMDDFNDADKLGKGKEMVDRLSVTNVCGFMRVATTRVDYRFFAAELQLLHSRKSFDYQSKAHPSVIRKEYKVQLPTSPNKPPSPDCCRTWTRSL